MTAILGSSSAAYGAVVSLLSGTRATTDDASATGQSTSGSQPSSSEPTDTVELSERAKATLDRAKAEQAAADKLSALLDLLTGLDSDSPWATSGSGTTTAPGQSAVASQTDPAPEVFAPKVTFASALRFGDFSISAVGNADTASSDVRIDGPNGFVATAAVFGGGAGTAEVSGAFGLKPGMSYTSQKVGNKEYFTITSASASATAVSVDGASQSSVTAESQQVTFVVDFDTGNISLQESDTSVSATVTNVSGAPTPTVADAPPLAPVKPSAADLNAATSAYTSAHARRNFARAHAERSAVSQLGAQLDASRGGPSIVIGTRRDDILRGGNFSAILGGAGNDVIRAGSFAAIDAGPGDDTVSAGSYAVVNGGDGNDRISTYDHASVAGGAGNDRISTYDHATVAGGDGDDKISTYGFSTIDGGNGNDKVSAYDHATVYGGAGNDRINTDDWSSIWAGAGNDIVTTFDYSNVDGGSGNDVISAGGWSTIDAGDGDDIVTAGRYSTITGGAGDDTILVSGSHATLKFGKGDGHDVVKANRDMTISLAGYSKDDVIVTRTSKGIVLSFKGSDDSILLDLGGSASAKLTFADNGSLTVGQ